MTASLARTRQVKPEGEGVGPRSPEARCEACGRIFSPKREWQRFCTTPCRQAFHAKLTPEALRRDIDELRRQVAALLAAMARSE